MPSPKLPRPRPALKGAVACLSVALGVLQPLATQAFDALYAFGDSLTDTGNQPAQGFQYYQGRYCNGPLWIEYLSPQLGFPYNAGNNLAVSGAQTADVTNQVQQLATPVAATNALFVVWAGANDFIQSFTLLGTNDTLWNTEITKSVNDLAVAVTLLYGKGARTLLVPNLVDLTRTPGAMALPLPAGALIYYRAKVDQFNAALATALGAIQQAHSDLKLFAPDAHTEFNALLDNYTAYGFTKTNIDALDDRLLSDKSFTGPGSNYVFWDLIHPTTKVHALLAQWLLYLLPPPQSPQLGARPGAGNALQLSLTQLQVGRTYTLQVSTNLGAWSDAGSITATNAAQPATVSTNPAPVLFYRLKS